MADVAEERIKKGDASHFSIPIGSPVIIEPHGLGEKIRTYFIGMEKKSYIIVSLTSFVGDNRLVFDYLYKGNRTKLFYTQEGVVNGFIAKVLLYTTSPFRHIYFNYPTDAEFCNLRKSTRTDCHLPAVIEMNGSASKAMVVNISDSGCALSVKTQHFAGSQLNAGDIFTLRFFLTQAMEEFRTVSEVKNIRQAEGKIQLGLMFHDLSEKQSRRIQEFIDYVISYKM